MTDLPVPKLVRVIGPHLDRATFVERKSHERTYAPTDVYASSLHLECLRQLAGPLLGWEAKELDRADWLRNAKTGSSMHENYQELMLLIEELTKGTDVTVRVAGAQEVLDHAGFSITDFSERQQEKWKDGIQPYALELPLPKLDKRISGRGDGIFRLNGTFTWTIEEKGEEPQHGKVVFRNELVVMEIKTVKHKDWVAIQSKSSNKYKKYYAQMQAYMHFYKIRRCILFMVNRNDDSVKELLINYDPAYMRRKLGKVAEMWTYVDNGQVPPATFDQYGDCLFCPYKAKCELEELMNGV